MAHFGGFLATDLLEVVDLVSEPDVLDRGGWWAVEAGFEGRMTAYRFGNVRPAPLAAGGAWRGPSRQDWSSSLDHDQYVAGVCAIRERIAAGDVYQVNLCRVLSARLREPADPLALAARIFRGNPAPYQGVLHTGSQWLVTASPELFLSKSGPRVISSPVKGTARPGSVARVS